MGKTACALFFVQDLVTSQVHPFEGGCEKAIGERWCQGIHFCCLKASMEQQLMTIALYPHKARQSWTTTAALNTTTSVLLYILKPNPKLWATTSPFHPTEPNLQQLGTAQVLNTDEPHLLQLTTEPEQNVQAEPDQYTLCQRTINISQWAGRELGTRAEALPRSLPWLPRPPFSYNRVQFRRIKTTRAHLFLLKRTDPQRKI